MQWYEILVQDRFVEFFKSLGTNDFIIAEGQPLFEEFRDIVFGMTMACAMGDDRRTEYSKALEAHKPNEAVGYNHFLDTCPNGKGRFAAVWRSMQNPYETDAEDLSAEQVAVLILYPFWSRMGGSFEVEFAQDGRLRKYLCVLKEKVMVMNKKKKLVAHMSYLEAHKIFNDYVDAVVRSGEREKVPFYRKSAFRYSKEEITYAYKVFMAVAYRYGNKVYTPQIIDSYNSVVGALLVPWVDDEFADEYIECKRILNDNSLWGKFKNRTAIPYVREKLERLNKELLTKNKVDGFIEEKNAFTEAIVKLVNESVQRAKALPEDPKVKKIKLSEIVDDYCWDAYDIIGLALRQEDIDCFWPMPILYQFSTHPETGKRFTDEQKRYIEQNSTG